MTGQQALTLRISEAIRLSQTGGRRQASELFTRLWAELGPAGDPCLRCCVAHHMADVQNDPRDSLVWNRRALAAADEVTDERARECHPSLSARGLYPSLHLNLAENYRLLGHVAKAREHLTLAYGCIDALNETGYGRMIRTGIDRLAQRITVA